MDKKKLLVTVAGLLTLASAFAVRPGAAADMPLEVQTATPDAALFAAKPIPTYNIEVGARYWFGWADTGKALYSTDHSALVSRLTYTRENLNAGEAFGRIDTSMGFFLKGYIGAGSLNNGGLKDEDFPPFTDPFGYSATSSDQQGGHIRYGSVDVGADVVRGPNYRAGLFVGYHYLNQLTNADGCMQLAANPVICQPQITTDILGITQNNTFHSLRVGVTGDYAPIDRLKLSVDAAWLPYVKLMGSDTHWLRIGPFPGDFAGPIQEDGKGWGFQVDAMLTYAVNDWLDVGLGARYWHVQTSGASHFEGDVVGFTAFPQPVDWHSDNYGVFAQVSLKLGPYPFGLSK